MLTLGVDLAAQPENTAACEVRWHRGHAEVVEWHTPLSDANLLDLINQADLVGIDVPLGWPTQFVRAIHSQLTGNKKWPNVPMNHFRLRATDRFVNQKTGIWPLSVSTDRIGIPAARAASLLSKLSTKLDRTGLGKIVEVYPAAALKTWELRYQSYKGSKGRALRDELVLAWSKRTASWGKWTDEGLERAQVNDNLFDSLICATVARCAALSLTFPIPPSLRRKARLEGWIAVPLPGSLTNLFPG